MRRAAPTIVITVIGLGALGHRFKSSPGVRDDACQRDTYSDRTTTPADRRGARHGYAAGYVPPRRRAESTDDQPAQPVPSTGDPVDNRYGTVQVQRDAPAATGSST